MEYKVPQAKNVSKYSAQGFLSFISSCRQNEICFTLWWRLWQHVSTDIKVSRPLGSFAFFHVLELVRAASSSFVERCKQISCLLQGKGGELDIFCHIPPVSSCCTISCTILQIENLCIYYLTYQHPDRSSNAMLTFYIEWSLFPHLQETSQCQRQWHVLHMFIIRFQIGTSVIKKEISLHSKQARKPLSFGFQIVCQADLTHWLLFACF